MIRLVIIFVLIIIILSLLGVSLDALINNKTLHENFTYVWRGVVWLWQNYLLGYIQVLWETFKNLFS